MNNNFVTMTPLDEAFNLHFTEDSRLTNTNMINLEKRVLDLENEVNSLKQQLQQKINQPSMPSQFLPIINYITSTFVGLFYKEPVSTIENDPTLESIPNVVNLDVPTEINSDEVRQNLYGVIDKNTADQMLENLELQRDLELKNIYSKNSFENASKAFSDFMKERNEIAEQIYLEKVTNEKMYFEELLNQREKIEKEYNEMLNTNAKYNINLSNEPNESNTPNMYNVCDDIEMQLKQVSHTEPIKSTKLAEPTKSTIITDEF